MGPEDAKMLTDIIKESASLADLNKKGLSKFLGDDGIAECPVKDSNGQPIDGMNMTIEKAQFDGGKEGYNITLSNGTGASMYFNENGNPVVALSGEFDSYEVPLNTQTGQPSQDTAGPAVGIAPSNP